MSDDPICFTAFDGKMYGVYLVPSEDQQEVDCVEPEALTEKDFNDLPEWYQQLVMELAPSREFLAAIYSGLKVEGEGDE